MSDIEESIKELTYYRKKVFVASWHQNTKNQSLFSYVPLAYPVLFMGWGKRTIQFLLWASFLLLPDTCWSEGRWRNLCRRGCSIRQVAWQLRSAVIDVLVNFSVTVHWFRVRRFPLKAGLKMLIFSSNCHFGSKFWIRPDEDFAFLLNTYPKCSPGTRMEPWTPEPLNPWTPTFF